MAYKFARLENGSIKKYEFSSIQQMDSWAVESLKDFREENKVKDQSNDISYLDYKEELHDSVMKSADDYLKCKRCSESEHEDQFCRCESRNMRIAKENRKRSAAAYKA